MVICGGCLMLSIFMLMNSMRPILYTMITTRKYPVHLLLGLEVVEENGAFLGFLTPVLDHDA